MDDKGVRKEKVASKMLSVQRLSHDQTHSHAMQGCAHAHTLAGMCCKASLN